MPDVGVLPLQVSTIDRLDFELIEHTRPQTVKPGKRRVYGAGWVLSAKKVQYATSLPILLARQSQRAQGGAWQQVVPCTL
jgi:hypothetical protein